MATTLTALDAEAIAEARALLARPVRRVRMWPVLAAAAALATSSLALATAMLAAPPLVTQHVAHSAAR
jgi:hypothetical protein